MNVKYLIRSLNQFYKKMPEIWRNPHKSCYLQMTLLCGRRVQTWSMQLWRDGDDARERREM